MFFSKCFRSIDSLTRKWRRELLARLQSPPKKVWRRPAFWLESLEDRIVPQGSSFNQDFVTQVYTDLLHRNVDSGGLTAWVGELNAGVSPANVVMEIEQSAEFRNDLVEQMYETYLGRWPDAGGLSFWAGELTVESVPQVEAGIIGSAEFYGLAGGTNQGFLDALYADVLHRGVDPSGEATWMAALNGGESPGQVAYSVLTSAEGYSDLVDSLYEEYLHRPVDSAGLANDVAALESGASEQEIIAGILSSAEYETRTPNAPDVTRPSTAVAVSTTTDTITGTAENGSLVQIYSDGAVVGSEQLVGQQTNFSITVSLTSNAANNFEVAATNAFGNQSPQKAVPTITQGATATVTVTTPAEQMNREADTVDLTIGATDSAGNALTYTATGLPAGLSIDSTTGVISGIVSTGDSATSPYTVTITATDTTGATGSATFTWLVDNSTNPTVVAPANQTNTEGDAVSSVTVTATEPNKNPLTYSATDLPAGLSINANTGVISGTIDAEDAASSPYTVTVSATDGLNTGSATFTWTVNAVVAVTSQGDQTDAEGQSISDVDITATDSNANVLTYSATNLPSGLSIDPTTGVISGTIGADDAANSPYTVTVTATDGAYSGSTSFTWTVNPIITVTAPANQTNTEGDSVTDVDVTATDSNNSTLTYTAANLPPGLSIDTSTGAMSGTIGSSDETGSPYTVTVTASDGTYSSSAVFTWTVNPAVVVTSPGDQTNAQGTTVSGITVSATNSTGGTLTYVATGLPPGLSIDTTGGAISGVIGDSDSPTAPYTVTVTASDGTYSGSTTFTWTVTPVVAVTAPADQTNAAGDTVSDVAVMATDANTSALTYVATGLPAGLSIGASTGAIDGAIGSSDATGSPYTVTVTASDGAFSGSASFTWTVTSAPTAPTVATPAAAVSTTATTYTIAGTAPGDSLVQIYSDGSVVGSDQLASGSTAYTVTVTLTASATNDFTVTATDAAGSVSAGATVPIITQSSSVVTVTTPAEQLNHEQDSVDLAISATDTSGGTLTYSATGLPTGLSIDASSGAITGTIATGDATSSPYTATATATDGTNSSTATFTWLVDDGTVPSVTSPGDQTNAEGDTVSGITVSATTDNNNPLTYSASGLPAGLSIDPTTGIISGAIAPGDATNSPYTVTISATDGLDSGSSSFTWTVQPAITFTNPGDQTNTEGDTVNLQVSATDSLGNPLTYVAMGLPAGLSIDASSGLISGTVAAGDAASSPHSVTVFATDGTYSSSSSFQWTVNADIVVTSPGNQTNTEGDAVSGVTVSATDDLGGTLVYTAAGLPAGLSIDPNSGVISGIIDNNAASTTPYTVIVFATDGTYSGSTTFAWTVNSAVTATSPGNQTNTEGDSPSIAVAAADSTDNALVYTASGLPAGLSIGLASGIISGTIAPGAAANSPYTVDVTATDGTYSGSAVFTWTVDPVVTLTAPTNQSNNEGDSISGVTVTGSDSLGGTLSYTASGLPTGLSIDSSTGVISGTIATGDANSSPYTVTVTATDGTYGGSTTFTWTIAPSDTPIITVPVTQQNAEGDTVTDVQVAAAGSGTMTYSATNLPSGLSINNSTGAIAGTVVTGDSAESPYTVTVTVSNGTNSSSASFTWVVTTSSSSTLPFSLTSPNWVTLPSGVRIWDVTTGTGTTAEAGDTITVNFTGYLTNGTEFPGGSGADFSATLNTSSLIAGWVDGIPGMQVGGERRIDIPASLAYGDNPPAGSDIPDNAELIFDITLTAVGT